MGDRFCLCQWDFILPSGTWLSQRSQGTEQQSAFWHMQQILQKPDQYIACCGDFGVTQLLQWKAGNFQTSLFFPVWPETLCVCLEWRKAKLWFLVFLQAGWGWEMRMSGFISGMLGLGLQVGPCISQEEVVEGQRCS